MARYIDADKFIEELRKLQGLQSPSLTKATNKAIDLGLSLAMRMAKKAPTADVMEVVRCGYCVNSVPNGLFSVKCEKLKCCMSKSNFCSCGAKMDGRSED